MIIMKIPMDFRKVLRSGLILASRMPEMLEEMSEDELRSFIGEIGGLSNVLEEINSFEFITVTEEDVKKCLGLASTTN